MKIPIQSRRLDTPGEPGEPDEAENLVRRLSALYSQDVIGVDIVHTELASAASGDGATGEIAESREESLGAAAERHLRTYFAAHDNDLPAAGLYGRVVREIERPLIELSLAATGGNQIKAAKLLGLNRNTLRKKIRELDIRVLRGLK